MSMFELKKKQDMELKKHVPYKNMFDFREQKKTRKTSSPNLGLCWCLTNMFTLLVETNQNTQLC